MSLKQTKTQKLIRRDYAGDSLQWKVETNVPGISGVLVTYRAQFMGRKHRKGPYIKRDLFTQKVIQAHERRSDYDKQWALKKMHELMKNGRYIDYFMADPIKLADINRIQVMGDFV